MTINAHGLTTLQTGDLVTLWVPEDDEREELMHPTQVAYVELVDGAFANWGQALEGDTFTVVMGWDEYVLGLQNNGCIVSLNVHAGAESLWLVPPDSSGCLTP